MTLDIYLDDTAAKRMSMRIGVNSSAGAKFELQTKCMKVGGLRAQF